MAENGTLAFLKGSGVNAVNLEVLDPKTQMTEPLVERMDNFGQYSISPDGTKVAVEIESDHVYDIHILDIKRGLYQGNRRWVGDALGSVLF